MSSVKEAVEEQAVSAWVTRAIEDALLAREGEGEWREMVAEARRRTTPEERRRLDELYAKMHARDSSGGLHPGGITTYAPGMAFKRITISVPEELVAKIKKAAGEQSVSGWFADLAENRLLDEESDRLWDEWIGEAERTATPEDLEWVEDAVAELRELDRKSARKAP